MLVLPKSLKQWLLIALVALNGFNCVVFFVSRFAEIPEKSALRGWDNSFYYFWLRSLVEDGDWEFANDIRSSNTLAPEGQGTGMDEALALDPTPVNQTPNKYGIGWAVAHSSFYLAANASVQLLDLLGMPVRNDGFGIVHQLWVMLGGLAISFGGLFLVWKIAARYGDRETALISVMGFVAVSPAIYYLFANLTMAHHLVFALHATALTLFLQLRESPGKARLWLLLGLTLGLAAVTRFQFAILGLYPVILVLTHFCKYKRDTLRGALYCVGGILLPCLLQLVAWKIVYGQWLLNTYAEDNASHFRWADPVLLKTLFSADHGLFYWHPLLILGVIAVAGFLRRDRTLAGIAMAICLATWYINASNAIWNFGASFGHRGYVGLLPLIMVAGAWALYQMREKTRHWILLMFLVFGIWNTHLCLVYVFGWIERNGPVTYPELFSAVARIYQSLFAALGLL